MADVMILGGGLTGLAAAYELEKQGVDYTLIEVKKRLAGSIISERRDGFVLDGGAFVLRRTQDWPFLAELGLADALFSVENPGDAQGEWVAFKDGTQVLTDALAAQLKHGRILMQMAVSTIGKVGEHFTVCMENGMVLQAAALIITIPARFTERLFYTFQPQISARLLNFHYDNITRVSLGYRSGDISLPVVPPPDPGYAFGHWTDNPYRVPEGYVLLQIGVRFALADTPPVQLVNELARAMNWPEQPVVSRVDYWPESHSLSPHTPEHDATMSEIEALLPPGIALAGGDYRAVRFEQRVLHGQRAARQVADWLKSR